MIDCPATIKQFEVISVFVNLTLKKITDSSNSMFTFFNYYTYNEQLFLLSFSLNDYEIP